MVCPISIDVGRQTIAQPGPRLSADRGQGHDRHDLMAPAGDVGACWRALRQSAVQAQVWLLLARAYAENDLRWQAAYAARQATRLDAALDQQIDQLDIGAWRDPAAGDGRLGRAALPDIAALVLRFEAFVARTPGDWLSWLYIARLREMARSLESDASSQPAPDPALDQARELEFLPGETLHWMGVWRLNSGDAQGAVAALGAMLGLRSQRHGSMMYLGEALMRIGNAAAAEKAFERAAQSSNPGFLVGLANRVYQHNYWQEAIAILRRAIELRPGDVTALLALARIQHEVYALADCRDTLDRIKTLSPENPEARLLEAGMLGRMGDARGHLAMLRRAYDGGGDPRSRLASSIAMTALYDDTMPPAAVAALHRRLCAPIEAGLEPLTRFSNGRETERRLRIGFVTGDLHRQHPVNLFLLPMLGRFNRARVEIRVYFTGTMHDAYTRQAAAQTDHWRDMSSLDDDAIQAAIVGDGVDILIDLAGHTSSHRLGVFAKRAAPVQATFLGYPHSTGLSQMDWLIGDATVSPAAHAGLFSEGIAQLPYSVFCWAPVDEYPLPRARRDAGPVVFGSFNNAMKLSPRTIALWARVLTAVPDALLLLKAPSLHDPAVHARFAALFAAHRIGRERLIFRGPTGLAEMMQEYGDIDIALDPTPYNGGTTTLQALWMGVPVLAIAGGNFVSRMGASFLTTLNMPDCVAPDEEGYVAAAVRMAGQVSVLRRSRGALRARMQASPLCDIAGYTADFEALLRRMWRAYCGGAPAHMLPAIRSPATTAS